MQSALAAVGLDGTVVSRQDGSWVISTGISEISLTGSSAEGLLTELRPISFVRVRSTEIDGQIRHEVRLVMAALASTASFKTIVPPAPGWAMCVEYQEGTASGEVRRGGSGRAAKKIDCRAVLSEADFAVFSKLRELRKSLAESEGVSVYAIFTNEQLADVAKARPPSKAGLGKIDGIGQGRVPASFHDAGQNGIFPGVETPVFVPWPLQGRWAARGRVRLSA